MATILPPTLATRAAGMILFITRKWPPAVGGMETYSVKLSQALQKLSTVEVMALPGLILGNRTHLCCIVFSPIDALENRRISP